MYISTFADKRHFDTLERKNEYNCIYKTLNRWEYRPIHEDNKRGTCRADKGKIGRRGRLGKNRLT